MVVAVALAIVTLIVTSHSEHRRRAAVTATSAVVDSVDEVTGQQAGILGGRLSPVAAPSLELKEGFGALSPSQRRHTALGTQSTSPRGDEAGRHLSEYEGPPLTR